MKVYKGLLHQKGYQRGKGVLGSILKFGVPVVGGLLGELVGGLIKGKIQKGSGIQDLSEPMQLDWTVKSEEPLKEAYKVYTAKP